MRSLPNERRITIHESMKEVMREEVKEVENTKTIVNYLLFKNYRDSISEFYLSYKNSNSESKSNFATKL